MFRELECQPTLSKGQVEAVVDRWLESALWEAEVRLASGVQVFEDDVEEIVASIICEVAPPLRSSRSEAGKLVVERRKSVPRRLKELERENSGLRRAVSDMTLEKLVLKEAAGGNF